MDVSRCPAIASSTPNMSTVRANDANAEFPTAVTAAEVTAANAVVTAADKYVMLAIGDDVREADTVVQSRLDVASKVVGAVLEHYATVRCAARGGKFEPCSIQQAVLNGVLAGALRGYTAAIGRPNHLFLRGVKDWESQSAEKTFRTVMAAYAVVGMRSST